MLGAAGAVAFPHSAGLVAGKLLAQSIAPPGLKR